MPRQARSYGSWDICGGGGAVSGDDDGIGEPDAETEGDHRIGRVGGVISLYPYVPLNRPLQHFSSSTIRIDFVLAPPPHSDCN